MIRQFVVRYPDKTYTVRTFMLIGSDWQLAREVLADARSIAQATLDGAVIDAEFDRSGDT